MEIKIYVRTTEPWSHTLENYLEANHIPYTKIDVSDDFMAYQEMVRKSGQKKVPVIDIDGRVLTGFKPELILKALNDCQGGRGDEG